jgi:branched-chain amino acid transport system ATP-binding protein
MTVHAKPSIASTQAPSPPTMHGGLVVERLRVTYGHVPAVRDLDLNVRRGEILALLGPNGAGKSSIVRGISGIAPSSASKLSVAGISLLDMRPDERARYVAHVPEGRHLFANHTVRENLVLGAFGVRRHERRSRIDGVLDLLPDLAPHLGRSASALSGGQQQMVAIARGLMAATPVLIVDEMSLGLAPIVARSLTNALGRLRDNGLAVILVEQHVPLALDIADRAIVIDHGRSTLSGATADIASRAQELQAAYMGTSESATELGVMPV